MYLGERVHAYAFVFDASNWNTFDTLFTLIDTIKEIEKSARKGKRTLIYESKKICIGNKKDLKKNKKELDKNDLKKFDGMRFREVSALTNTGVYEAFKALISDIYHDQTLNKEYQDMEK